MIERIAASQAGLQALAEIRALLQARGDGSDTPVCERRAAMLAFAQAAPAVAGVTLSEERLGKVRAIRADPPESVGHVLFLHGGAYVLGSAETHKGLAARYALASGLSFHVIDYALAPEQPYPAGLEDALAAWAALTEMGHAPALAGDSAGGGLALATAIALRDRKLPMPAAIAVTSPWVDLGLSGPSMSACAEADVMLSRRGLAQDADRYRAGLDRKDPRVSPLFADLAGLPPVLVQVGAAEVLRDDALRLEAKLNGAGVPCLLELWDGMTHAWAAFGPQVPEAGASIDRFGRWLRSALLG
jgi:acetyl esterase/lipase